MAKLLLREDLHIVVRCKRGDAQWGNGRATYFVDRQNTNLDLTDALIEAKQIHRALLGDQRVIVDGSELPGDMLDAEGLIHI